MATGNQSVGARNLGLRFPGAKSNGSSVGRRKSSKETQEVYPAPEPDSFGSLGPSSSGGGKMAAKQARETKPNVAPVGLVIFRLRKRTDLVNCPSLAESEP